MFRSYVRLTHNQNPFKLDVHDNDTSEIIKTSLVEYVHKNCPSLAPGAYFSPTLYLWNGHLQTAYAAYKNFEKNFIIPYERKLVPTPDGGQIAVDWAPRLADKPFDNTPTLVVLHGLTGGSHESYIRALLDKVINPPYNYRAVVVNFRGCAESELLTPQLYNGAYTDDLRIALKYIQNEIPNAVLMAIGFSLGSNVLVKYLGEEGEKAPFAGAMSVGNPFDFVSSNLHLERTFIGKYVYSRSMANSLKQAFMRHELLLLQNEGININEVRQAQTIREFDKFATAKAFGYDTVNDYYRDASSVRFVTSVRVPLLCLNAVDDPIAPGECIPYDECEFNPYVILATTSKGGHLGFFEGFFSPDRWCVKPLLEFTHAIFQARRGLSIPLSQ